MTKINSNEVSNNVSNNGDAYAADKSHISEDPPNLKSQEKLEFLNSESVKINYQHEEEEHDDYINSQGDDEILIPSEDFD